MLDAATLVRALGSVKRAAAEANMALGKLSPELGNVIVTAAQEVIDGKLDARVDAFANEDDPEFTGWHRIEYLLWEKSDTAAAVPFADQLDADLAVLQTEIGSVTIEPAILAVGSAELIEEVSTGKITGEEDRYSHTDLCDFAANVEGSKQAYSFLRPSLEKADAALATAIDAAFVAIEASLEPYRDGTGWKSFETLTEAASPTMKAQLATLSEKLAEVAGALGL